VLRATAVGVVSLTIRCHVGERNKEREANVARPGDTRQHASLCCVGPWPFLSPSVGRNGRAGVWHGRCEIQRYASRRPGPATADGARHHRRRRRLVEPGHCRRRLGEPGHHHRRLGKCGRLPAEYADGVPPPSSACRLGKMCACLQDL
jgi:hypothetical protein